MSLMETGDKAGKKVGERCPKGISKTPVPDEGEQVDYEVE